MDRGWATEPIPLTEAIDAELPLTPRFAIEGKETKFRAIDDFKASGVNGIIETMDATAPDNLDALLAMAAYFSLIAKEPDLKVFTTDCPRAYKHVGIPVRHSGFATILLAPPEGPLQVATLRTQPFGSARTPADWGRVTRFIQFVRERMFGLKVFVYVDDCFASKWQAPFNQLSSVSRRSVRFSDLNCRRRRRNPQPAHSRY